MSAEEPLETRPAYRLWAATYDVENPLTTMDLLAVRFFSHDIEGKDLLDAACGTARRLVFPKGRAPKSACGVDLVFEMLAAGRRDGARPRATAGGDLRALPLSSEVRPFYERAKKLDRYAKDAGLPLLLALRFSR